MSRSSRIPDSPVSGGTSGHLLGWAELPCPLKAATVWAVAPGPGLARRRRARSAVTLR